jgi:hypothetical protein
MSTTSDADLEGSDGAHYRLRAVSADEQEPAIEPLAYPFRWFVECRFGGCSCHFRNFLEGNPPEFWEPQDWFEEDPDDVEATRAFYDLLSQLVREGHRVDIATAWSGDEVRHALEVSLSKVSRADFRFMDAYRFEVVP